MSCERSSALAPVSRPSDVAASGIRRKSLLPMSSSKVRAAASPDAEDAAGDPVAPGSRLHADMSGRVAAAANLAMAWRRVNKESKSGISVVPILYSDQGDEIRSVETVAGCGHGPIREVIL